MNVFSNHRFVTAIAVGIMLAVALSACSREGVPALRDTAWELVSLAGGDLIPGTTITLRFSELGDPESAISGSAGCNTYGGGYTASKESAEATQGSLTFSGVYATEMGCMEPKGVMQQEQAYLNALYAAARYSVAPDGGSGDRLQVYDEAGAQLLVFITAGTGSAAAPAATVVAAAMATTVPPTPVPTTATPPLAPPAGFTRYADAASGVSLWLPEGWLVVEPAREVPPDQPRTTILQSYPEDKYVGGEARQPGDSKCDLTIHPPGVGAADVLWQSRSSPTLTVVSEQELVLNSGQVGTRREIDSMGRSLSLVAEVGERTVVLSCFGELAPFDEIAVTLGYHAS